MREVTLSRSDSFFPEGTREEEEGRKGERGRKGEIGEDEKRGIEEGRTRERRTDVDMTQERGRQGEEG